MSDEILRRLVCPFCRGADIVVHNEDMIDGELLDSDVACLRCGRRFPSWRLVPEQGESNLGQTLHLAGAP